jgi:hypothetical protein
MASGTFRTGRYSKFLPKKLAERYRNALMDPDAKSHKDELALIDSKMSELLESLEGPEDTNWTDIWGLVELRRRVLESETRRMKDAADAIPIEELLILTRYIGDTIQRAVLQHTDIEAGRLIIADVTRALLLCQSKYDGGRPQPQILPDRDRRG